MFSLLKTIANHTMANLEDLKSKLDGIKQVKTADVKENPKIQLDEDGKKIDRRRFNKRTPGSGRKTKHETLIKNGVKAWINEHANEAVEVTILDRKTGKTITIPKPRLAYAMEKLFEIGTKGLGDAHAINMWLDRYIGKPSQPIKGEGEDNAPINVHMDNLPELLRKVYGKNKE